MCASQPDPHSEAARIMLAGHRLHGSVSAQAKYDAATNILNTADATRFKSQFNKLALLVHADINGRTGDDAMTYLIEARDIAVAFKHRPHNSLMDDILSLKNGERQRNTQRDLKITSREALLHSLLAANRTPAAAAATTTSATAAAAATTTIAAVISQPRPIPIALTSADTLVAASTPTTVASLPIASPPPLSAPAARAPAVTVTSELSPAPPTRTPRRRRRSSDLTPSSVAAPEPAPAAAAGRTAELKSAQAWPSVRSRKKLKGNTQSYWVENVSDAESQSLAKGIPKVWCMVQNPTPVPDDTKPYFMRLKRGKQFTMVVEVSKIANKTFETKRIWNEPVPIPAPSCAAGRPYGIEYLISRNNAVIPPALNFDALIPVAIVS